MTTLHIRRLFGIPCRRVPVRNTGSIADKTKPQQLHIYKKTYTKNELMNHIMENIVYDSSDYIVTSVPQGVKFLNNQRWNDSEKETVCDDCLQDMIPELCKLFSSEYLFVTKHPRRNASGILILSRNFRAFQLLRRHFSGAEGKLIRIFTYLAVVIGCPTELLYKTFRIEQLVDGQNLFVRILESLESDSIKTVRTKYHHEVLDSTKKFSLLKISVSYDLRDCVRHILAQKCFTPVFGDFWNVKRAVNFLFGGPLLSDQASMRPGPYELSPEILEKLKLNKDEQKFIPIHAHLYGLKLELRNKSEFFVSVPPPESFVWTCKQLGLNEIERFADCSPKK